MCFVERVMEADGSINGQLLCSRQAFDTAINMQLLMMITVFIMAVMQLIMITMMMTVMIIIMMMMSAVSG